MKRTSRKKESKRHQLSQLAEALRSRFPATTLSLDLAETATGDSFLDLDYEGQQIAVQWRQGIGFGVSTPDDAAYGEGPDETYTSMDATCARIESLLLSGSATIPPPSARIAELRKARGISQQELARTLNINQAAISKLEHRNDVRLSTLREVVGAMGGELLVVARFPDGLEKALEFDPPTPEKK